jgi:hypothetical protein
MWLATRLEYWISFWRCATSHIVSGSGPTGCHIWTAKIREFPARIVVKNGFGRRVGKNSAIPIELAVDADGREGRRQRAARHDVLDGVRRRVEIDEITRPDVDGADTQAGRASIETINSVGASKLIQDSVPVATKEAEVSLVVVRIRRAVQIENYRPSGWRSILSGSPCRGNHLH